MERLDGRLNVQKSNSKKNSEMGGQDCIFDYTALIAPESNKIMTKYERVWTFAQG